MTDSEVVRFDLDDLLNEIDSIMSKDAESNSHLVPRPPSYERANSEVFRNHKFLTIKSQTFVDKS